tara:strand:+ start:402 stop:1487 length:1086 start_codon:yes stop_codon:yes gene_type:complete
MSDSKNKQSKKEDFIDLDNSQYKKKTNYIRNAYIFLIFFSLFFSTGFYFDDILDFFKRLNKSENVSDSELIDFSPELESLDYPIDSRKNFLETISENERKEKKNSEENTKVLEDSILNANSRSMKNLEKIKETERLLENLNRRMDELSLINIEGNLDEEISYGNKSLIYFNILKKNYSSRKNFGEELDRLLDFYENHEKLKNLLEFFSKLEVNSLKTKSFLLKELINNLQFYDESFDQFIARLEKDERFQGKKIFESKENFLNYLRSIFNSTFKITKLENSEIREGQQFNYNQALKESLLLAKEFLLLNDLEKSIETIENSNFSLDNVKYWLDEANAILKADERMDELESELLIVIGSNFD